MAHVKDSSYFSHDSNARRDPKILALRSIYGMEGYGWYWIIIEMFREQPGFRLQLNSKYAFKAIAMELECDEERARDFVKDCIDEFGLFETDGQYFWSNSLLRRMEMKEERSNKARRAAQSKWGNADQSNEESHEYSRTRSKRLAEARKRGKHTSDQWNEMVQFFGGKCLKCEGESGLQDVVKDHIIPIYQGGSDGIDNLQPLCAKCNASKGPECKDYRKDYCLKNGIEFPSKWLPNACEMPANDCSTSTSKVKESKVNIKESKKDIYTPILQHWNTQEIIQHRKLTEKTRRSIRATLRSYSVEEVNKAISNYAQILQDPVYYWTHKWTLQEFLQRGIDKFLDWEIASSNFRGTPKSKPPQELPRGDPKEYAHEHKTADLRKAIEHKTVRFEDEG